MDPYVTLTEAAQGLRDGAFTATELARAQLDRIADVDDRVKAYVTVTRDEALADAARADEALARGDAGPLTGIPIAIKDLIVTKGVRTTCSSRMLENFIPVEDAGVMTRLREAGAVILGKTNMDEFAMGSSTEHSAFFPTANPWDLARVPGGSSGGSAAAVAAGEGIVSLGSDTGGSIRQPGSFCGCVGMKPTYGRVSRYGLIAFASSLDQIGPFARNVQDAATLLQAIAGWDPCDSTSANVPVPDFSAGWDRGVEGLRIAVPRELFAGADADVLEATQAAIDQLERLGATIDREQSLPSVEHALAAYYVLAPSEASANLARYDGVTYGYSYTEGASMWENMEQTRGRGFGDEVKRRIMLGTYALSAGYYDAYYKQAQRVRTLIRREFAQVFERCDLIVTPTAPTVAFKQGAVTDPYQMYLNDVFTIPVNIAGLPAISVPCGVGEGGMPVGLHLIGDHWGEPTLFRAAHAYEQSTDWHRRHPSL
ncbi:MAG: Asp-tRNA(Asn)/Glu-tRNA(Gln) amidotransferase subunit GatA [Chloroflexi bacterium]|nr:Asp-tRNA(Asn)/Glu-tRNA(Gln) amidotransferase subunit GatA [Chloroflexota bacterium]